MTGVLTCRKTVGKQDPAYRSTALHTLAASPIAGRELSCEKDEEPTCRQRNSIAGKTN
ncbi:MAG: hypothetical protein HXN56_08745 [Prevotella nigrescens]|nr:hypothetical protein [Prevotella nigrescens]